jgi:hypothetical protein
MKNDKVLTSRDLQVLLVGQKIELDCGHLAVIGQNSTHTVIIVSQGGGKIMTACHECGY